MQNLSPGFCQARGEQRGLGDTSVPLWVTEGPRTPPAPPGHEGVFPKPASVLGTLLQLHPTPERAPALPAHPFGGEGPGTLLSLIPLAPQGDSCVCQGVHPPTAESTGWGSFLETFMQLMRFQECVSELEQGFSVMILL